MSMQKQTWSISGLAVELGIDRRTLAKKLDSLQPVEVKGNVRLYRMADVIKCLRLFDNPQVSGSGEITDQQLADEIASFFDQWAPDLTDYFWRETGESADLDAAEKVLRMVQDIWAIHLGALEAWTGSGPLNIPEIIEKLQDPDQRKEAALELVEFGPRESEKPDIDLEGLLSKVDWKHEVEIEAESKQITLG